MRRWPILLLLFAGLAKAAPLDEIDALRLAGDYPGAIELARAELAVAGDDGRLLNRLGELLFATGELDAAAERFDAAIAAASGDDLLARFNRARVHVARGELDAARELWQTVRAAYQNRPRLSARDLFAIAGATRELGRSDPQLFQQAVRLYQQSSRQDPAFLDAGIALGELLLEKYNNHEARQQFDEVLRIDNRHPRALLGLARSQHFDYSTDAVVTALAALEINPNLVPARVFMARLFIELEQYDDARDEIAQALAINPHALDALAMLAVTHHLERAADAYARVEARVRALNPRAADFYNDLAELAAQNRLYRDAAEFAARAVALDAESWKAYGLLGMNQLRLGDIEAGRANLERSFSGDPYNVWIKNTLQLVDGFDQYELITSGRFEIVLHRDEKALLGEYIEAIAAEAYREFSERYQHQPESTVRIELYPEHADFSVRTVGLAGVGLLGVCFGPVVAMDSPAARAQGEFNWGSTLWHELAHVYHLSMTDNRVPRWFSEGLAVYEEHRARPGWGADVDPGFLRAYLDGKLLPVSQLNNGFVRPSYPEQVQHAYFQASLVFHFIDDRWGFERIRAALTAYRDSTDPDNVLYATLGIGVDEFDRAFDEYFRARYAGALAALEGDLEVDSADASEIPDKYFSQFDYGVGLYEQGNLELAELFLKRAQALFPGYAGANSSYWILAALYQQQGRPADAERELAAMTAINAEHYAAHLRLAELRAGRGDAAGAAAALEAALYIYPYDPLLHDMLAVQYASLGRWAESARERRALLALDPVDRAEAHYQLAYAYRRAGDRSSAREQILYALEIAPGFTRAQTLLLALHGLAELP